MLKGPLLIRTMTEPLTGALRIVHLAEAHSMRAQVYAVGWANAHLAKAVPNNDYYEQIVVNEDQIINQSITHLPPVINDYVTLLDRLVLVVIPTG